MTSLSRKVRDLIESVRKSPETTGKFFDVAPEDVEKLPKSLEKYKEGNMFKIPYSPNEFIEFSMLSLDIAIGEVVKLCCGGKKELAQQKPSEAVRDSRLLVHYINKAGMRHKGGIQASELILKALKAAQSADKNK